MADTMEKFWRKWLKADSLEKPDLLWPVVKMIEETTNLPKKHRKKCLSMCLNSYFEDLACVIEEMNNEKHRKGKRSSDKRKG